MAGREVMKYAVGTLLWVVLASVVLYQSSEIKSLHQQLHLLTTGDKTVIKRERRAADDSRPTDSTENCLNMNCNTGGATYTRWGKMNCSRADTSTVYSGIMGGSHYNVHGGGANYLCLSSEPQWGNVDTAFADDSPLFGTEFQSANQPFLSNPNGPAVLTNHDMPCSVCLANSRASSVMIPGRRECYPGWTREYRGYLMAGHKVHKGRFEFVCVDEMPDAESSGFRDDNGALLYTVEGVCGSLPCPPYVAGREISCVVCTK